jgi:sulfatase modifying factor 1
MVHGYRHRLSAASLCLLTISSVAIQNAQSQGPDVDIRLQGESIYLEWDPAAMGPVAVEHSPDLVEWDVISPSETGGVFQESVGSAAKGFYRLRSAALDGMITVLEGTLPESSSLSGDLVLTFQIGKYEVTWDEWQEVRDWAVENGYPDLEGIGGGSAGNHPVRDVNWYDVVKWCNAKSEMEELTPVYEVGASGEIYRTGQIPPAINSHANGYRLPTEAEWEWAARGGVRSRGYTYSGSDNIDAVAWYLDNSTGAPVSLAESGGGTWPVGQKAANELGIHDMSGNVWEWCENGVYGDVMVRMRGGSWGFTEDWCAVAFRWGFINPLTSESEIGFRLARNSDL